MAKTKNPKLISAIRDGKERDFDAKQWASMKASNSMYGWKATGKLSKELLEKEAEAQAAQEAAEKEAEDKAATEKKSKDDAKTKAKDGK